MKFFFCVSDNKCYKNFLLYFNIFWNFIIFWFVLFNFLLNWYVCGFDFELYFVIVEKFRLFVKFVIFCDFGLDGLNVLIFVWWFLEKKICFIIIFLIFDLYFCFKCMIFSGDKFFLILILYLLKKLFCKWCGIKCSGFLCIGYFLIVKIVLWFVFEYVFNFCFNIVINVDFFLLIGFINNKIFFLIFNCFVDGWKYFFIRCFRVFFNLKSWLLKKLYFFLLLIFLILVFFIIL